MFSAVFTFTISNPWRLPLISRTKFRLLSEITSLWTPSRLVPKVAQQTTVSNIQPYTYKIFFFAFKNVTQIERLVCTNVAKQGTYTNTEQETNLLPVCNIPAVTRFIDRWVLIGRVESNKASFLANGYFLRVSAHPLLHPF